MKEYFDDLRNQEGFASAELRVVFDAEVTTPHLLEHVAMAAPRIRDAIADLRRSLLVPPHCGVGPIGNSGFYRLPNHYRAVSYMLSNDRSEPGAGTGVIVFKGTEPLIGDFPEYLDWMLEAPFRTAPLPMGLHFPLDMKLPPACMWIEESVAEQRIASAIQQKYVDRHGCLARLPVPLFVLAMTPEQNARYRDTVRAKLPADAYNKIKNKLSDGLGVEVYYYPELPVRVADLFVGNVRTMFKDGLSDKAIESWTRLMAELLCLDAMPFAPWHHGMGACVDPGNACVDGGFNDLLTLVSFDAFPTEALFRRGLQASINLLAESIASFSAALLGLPATSEPDAVSIATDYVRDGLRRHVLAVARKGFVVDERLIRGLEAPTADDIANVLRMTSVARSRPNQYLSAAQISAIIMEKAVGASSSSG